MYDGRTDLTGFQEYFSPPFLVENAGDQSDWIMIARNKNKHYSSILILIPIIIVDLSSKSDINYVYGLVS